MSSLKTNLADSIEALSQTSEYQKPLLLIAKRLRETNVIIPEDGHDGIVKFVQSLMRSMPGILENNPNDTQLKNLCVHCMEQVIASVKMNSGRRR